MKITLQISGNQEFPDMTWTSDTDRRDNPAYEADIIQTELLVLVNAAVQHLSRHVKYRTDDHMRKGLIEKISVAVGVQPPKGP